MQTIVASLLWPDGDFPGVVMETGPWFDGLIYDFDGLVARLEAQAHRRYIKTHTPADGIPIFDTASYIVVARDGRDALVSYANHMAHMRAALLGRLNAEAIAQVFLFKGVNGRWREELTEGELRRYRHRVEELLAPEAAH